MDEIIFGKIRVELLQEDIIRIERAQNGKFCDGNTLVVPDRTQFENTHVSFAIDADAVYFGDYKLCLTPGSNGISGVSLEKAGKKIYKYKKTCNSGELPPLDNTPEVFVLADTPRIIVPAGGYTYRGRKKNSGYIIQENVKDIYLLLCKRNAKKLRKLYFQLAGRCDLPPLSVFGAWNSKYFKYSEHTAKQLISDYERHNIPLDYMVIDTDWRTASDRGIGYDVNTQLFPDVKRFFDFAHSRGVEIMFNDHPEPLEGAENVFSSEEVKYRETKLQSLLKSGLDAWWYDRNWITKLKSPTKGVNPETLGLYVFDEIIRHYRQKIAKNNTVYKRPAVMGNADNISNGSYLAIASSASHRFGIQWTGDIMSDPDALAQEIYNLIRGGNNGIAYLNADCGGHQGNPDKEWFIRWMQFGTLSPVFRPHCSDLVTRTREPWVYDDETCDIVREYINLRYRLLPVIYKNAYLFYMTGVPVFKALGWEYPEDKRALKCTDEYMLGEDILIAPIAGQLIEPLNKKHYAEPVKATYYDGIKCDGPAIAVAQYDTVSMQCAFNSPEKNVPVFDFSAIFETIVRFEDTVKLILRCDDGAEVWIDGEQVLKDDTLHSAKNFDLAILTPNQNHRIKIKYFQAGGEAECKLYYVRERNYADKKVYFPKGKWMDAFTGKIYRGNKTVCKQYGLKEMPLFVRLGSLIPLAYEAKNTKEQKWNRLVYDFYPDKTAIDRGYLYEDDTLTTAYQLGQFRKRRYEAIFCEECNAYIIKLHAAEGNFEGDKCFDICEITLKYHLLKGAGRLKKVTVNGEETGFKKVAKNKIAFPLGSCESAPDSSVIIVSEMIDVMKEYEFRFYL